MSVPSLVCEIWVTSQSSSRTRTTEPGATSRDGVSGDGEAGAAGPGAGGAAGDGAVEAALGGTAVVTGMILERTTDTAEPLLRRNRSVTSGRGSSANHEDSRLVRAV